MEIYEAVATLRKDKNIKISYVAKTTGTLDNIKFDYIVFKDSVKVKKPVFTLLG